ncbi:hypothetical protein [Malaciobacter marinus]|uniref:Putative membrane protein n=1 Tax=Malaciobacter marinus TaxID=505249 RepID=A0A347THB0_9BACT|nr:MULTISPECIES: hypothetical protein [Malaciobacter]AXX85988.1 putative membrane protein [Malaciobacter marinus]PHO12627.1 hypothetical protein CPG38_07215 [Malaciobacter marinus]PHO15253.1 hypothetical protein CPH92_07605 [Malaciobacter marinus]RYA23235.1 hypothetical protein CRU96_09165 [Malaciobacter halophilus]
MLLSLKQKIIDYVFTVSKQPILLKDLLIANSQYLEKLHVDPVKLGFRLKVSRAYLVYIVLVILFTVPFTTITHNLFANLDPHVSIIVAMVLTAVVFIFFNFFRVWLVDQIALSQIKKGWQIHFPFFPYKEYNKKINEIFQQSNKLELQKKDLQKYILDNLAD